MDAAELIPKVTDWAQFDDRVVAAGVCGSYARGQAKADPDINFCILTADRESLSKDRSWITGFDSGARVAVAVEDFNPVQSNRVSFGKTEPEAGICRE